MVHFKIFQWRDLEPNYVNADNIEVVRLRGRHLLFHPTYLSEVRSCDLVLDISTGDGFADIYGAKRFAYNALSKLCVLACRRPLLLPPQTIGPFDRRWVRLVGSFLLRSAKAVITRDDLSTQFARRFQLGSKLVEATDVAFRLPYSQPVKRSCGPPRVGINISGLLFNGGYTRHNMFHLKADYPALVRSLISRFLDREDCEVHLIGHVFPKQMPIEDDQLVCEALNREFPATILAPRFETPVAAKNYIARMDFFCGSRMHACIAAFSSMVPTMPIAYSRKFAGVFGGLGYRWCADCKVMTATEIADLTLKAYVERGRMKEAVERGMDVAIEKLRAYEKVLELQLANVAMERSK